MSRCLVSDEPRTSEPVQSSNAAQVEQAVSKEEGEILAKSLKASAYLECSALTREGVKNVFNQAIFHQLEEDQQRKMSEKKKCNLL